MTTRPLPEHGTLGRRKTHGCNCEPCRNRERDYMNTRARLIAYGRWQPYTDAEPVRAHVRMLMSYGIGFIRVGRLAGVSNGAMTKLLYGERPRNLAPTKRVRTTTADKILAVRPSLDNLADAARVDATGTQRRLQALIAIGWPQGRLAALLGVNRQQIGQQIYQKKAVEVATARNVRALYDQLWNVDPATCGVATRHIDQARAIAARHGWAPPAAWDDDWIDSPAALPDLGDNPDRYSALAEDATWLIQEHGYTREQAAHRLGITLRHLERALAHTRRDRQVAA